MQNATHLSGERSVKARASVQQQVPWLVITCMGANAGMVGKATRARKTSTNAKQTRTYAEMSERNVSMFVGPITATVRQATRRMVMNALV